MTQWLCEGLYRGLLTGSVGGAKLEAHTAFRAMSEEQLAALLATIKEDAGLREKLQGAAGLDAAAAMAKAAGFDVNKTDWLKYQAQQTLELSDEELEGVSGGTQFVTRDCGSFYPPGATPIPCSPSTGVQVQGCAGDGVV